MKPIRDVSRYHFPARDRAEEIPNWIRRLAKTAPKMSKADLARELYRCAAAAQEHVLGMSARLTVQERIAERSVIRHTRDIYEAENEAAHRVVSEAISDSFDPHGFFVYLLWGQRLESPLYVGMSTNIFGRLGSHMGDKRKRRYVSSIQLIRCDTERSMRKLEVQLIRKYRPSWNIVGTGKPTARRLRYS